MLESISIIKTSYPVVDFLEWQRQGSLDLTPFYQRRQVWNPRMKSLLLDSLLRGYPLPLIFLHSRLDVATSKTVRQVVDGQQRLRTILSYIDIDCLDNADDWDRFTVMRSHNKNYSGLAFHQLDEDIQTKLLQTPLSVNVLPSDIDDVTILTIFQRMNSTGLKLNDQEIRNAIYSGEFKEVAYELAYSQYQRWLSWSVFRKQDVAQMKEVELTSDLMGMLIRGVAARTKGAIDGLYKAYDAEIEDRPILETRFADTFDLMNEVYSEARAKSPLRRFRSTGWLYAVFALLSMADLVDLHGTPRLPDAEVPQRPHPSQVISALERAEVELRADQLDEDLAKVLRGATADRRSREMRIEFLRRLFQ